jgi:hypothetical protein
MTKIRNLNLRNNKDLKTTIKNKIYIVETKIINVNALNSNPLHGHQMLTKFSMVSHQNSLRVFTSL